MWRISGVIDGGLVNALVEMVLAMAIRLLNETTVEVCCLLEQLKSAKEHIEITIDAEDYYRIKDSQKGV